mmetsp:Transcript_23207/g.24144  ORF Transcript_23207/g.24144 Transcript_23207/m.24144 type:complete len:271 (+) Transcript_23207:392-1204(+)
MKLSGDLDQEGEQDKDEGNYIDIGKLKEEMTNYGVFEDLTLDSVNNLNNKKYTNKYYSEFESSSKHTDKNMNKSITKQVTVLNKLEEVEDDRKTQTQQSENKVTHNSNNMNISNTNTSKKLTKYNKNTQGKEGSEHKNSNENNQADKRGDSNIPGKEVSVNTSELIDNFDCSEMINSNTSYQKKRNSRNLNQPISNSKNNKAENSSSLKKNEEQDGENNKEEVSRLVARDIEQPSPGKKSKREREGSSNYSLDLNNVEDNNDFDEEQFCS